MDTMLLEARFVSGEMHDKERENTCMTRKEKIHADLLSQIGLFFEAT